MLVTLITKNRNNIVHHSISLSSCAVTELFKRIWRTGDIEMAFILGGKIRLFTTIKWD